MRNSTYHPVIILPENYEIYDFSENYDPHRILQSPFGVGRYNEKRPGMYKEKIFQENQRDIHIGIDIGAPVHTPIHAFTDGEIFLTGYNSAPGDYGYTLITRQQVAGEILYALYGHLSAESIQGKKSGQKIRSGEVIAWIGDKHENGGWNPHLHFQLSRVEPKSCDLPGVVSDQQREEALKIYPDPRLVLGPLY